MIERIHTFLALTLALAACSSAARSTRTADERAGGTLAEARAEITPLFERMQTTANAHDADGHLAAYAHDSALVFIINDQAIHGFAALLEQQRAWWKNGTSDVVYRLDGDPEYRMPAPGLVVETYFLKARRTLADGTVREGRLAVTDIWKKRPEGWRIIYAHESSGSAPSATSTSAGSTDEQRTLSGEALLVVDGEGVPVTRSFTATDLASLPRREVRVQAHHATTPSTFSGVSLSDVLHLAGAWDSTTPRGAWARSYAVVSAADGYRAVYGLTELDTVVTDKLVLLADRRDGERLAANEGPLRLVAPGEQRESRWVRRVVRITVRRADQ
ncbi:MAG TPA: molybdopterin-dependent oxidoreductase [Gemmatimonadaceae bacterium]|nr:molybdopterin-dependent oxidoreductase [Gemmatimonadaceae bacterium]